MSPILSCPPFRPELEYEPAPQASPLLPDNQLEVWANRRRGQRFTHKSGSVRCPHRPAPHCAPPYRTIWRWVNLQCSRPCSAQGEPAHPHRALHVLRLHLQAATLPHPPPPLRKYSWPPKRDDAPSIASVSPVLAADPALPVARQRTVLLFNSRKRQDGRS